MTTCPRCGRVADEDEIVCADCGMSLALARLSAGEEPASLLEEFDAEEEGGTWARDVKVWRLAALVCATCLVAATVAILLLNQGGSHKREIGLPLTRGKSTGPAAPASSTSSATSPTASRHSSASPSPTKPTPSRTGSRSASATPTRTTSAAPVASTSRRAVRSVHLAKGSLDPQCGRPHCYWLVVTLSGFPSGAHQVACKSEHSGTFATYTTSSVTSTGCSFSRPHGTLWVLVDGTYQSNKVAW